MALPRHTLTFSSAVQLPASASAATVAAAVKRWLGGDCGVQAVAGAEGSYIALQTITVKPRARAAADKADKAIPAEGPAQWAVEWQYEDEDLAQRVLSILCAMS